MLLELFEKKVIRFLFFGAITAAFNIMLIAIMIEMLQLETGLLRNLANFISIEISLIFTFVVYRTWVWRIKVWNTKGIFFNQLPKFHAASGLVILARILVIFPVLDWFGLSYIVNTFLGILAGSIANYFMGDKLIFRD